MSESKRFFKRKPLLQPFSPGMPALNYAPVAAWLAAAYLLLLPAGIPFHPPAELQDLLAPLLVAYIVLRWREALLIIRESRFTLPLFFALAFLSSLYHCFRGTGSFYDFSVFAYMGVLYLFFRLSPAGEQGQIRLGQIIVLLLLAGFATGTLALLFPGFPGKSLFYRDPYSANRGLALLSIRYQAFFANPNLLGSFYVVPLILLRPWLQRQFRACRNPQQWLCLLAVLACCLLPLLFTASKHLLISLAVLTGILLEARPEKRQRLLSPALAVLVLFAGVCLLTVLLPTFPLSTQFPFINTRCQGNYTIHQEIYLKMLASGRGNLLTGIGDQELRRQYPEFADRRKITAIMEMYDSPHWVEPFCTFMDPHNEYLNLASLFGLPALLAGFAFWLAHLRKDRLVLALFVLAVLVCCLWDDLFSKRWLWIALGLLSRTPEPLSPRPAGSQRPESAP